MNGISVIIPVWNEERNLRPLVKEIHRALSVNNTLYELVFVDDNSTDASVRVLRLLARSYPIQIHN